ncbi:MAG: hypothetical protein U0414_26915 [Polyangiaceae bacterium]
MRRQRRAIRPPDMTSLFDVLFILVFVSLVNVGVNHTETEEAEAKAKSAADALASASAALASASAALSARPSAAPSVSAPPATTSPPVDLSSREATLIVRIDKDGVLQTIERADQVVVVRQPLLEPDEDPDRVVRYRGIRSPELRICAIVASKLGLPDLSRFVVAITTEATHKELVEALNKGIETDQKLCADEQKGFALVANAPAAPPGGSP